jgi:hypothetical protein
MKAYSLLTLLIIVMIAGGCSKNDAKIVTSGQLQGNYTGRVVVDSGNKSVVINSGVTLQISGANFKAETNGHTPLPSSGSYAIKTSQVTFADSLFYPAIYTMSFILSGTFNAQVKGDSLILVKDDNSYSYRFKRQ